MRLALILTPVLLLALPVRGADSDSHDHGHHHAAPAPGSAAGHDAPRLLRDLREQHDAVRVLLEVGQLEPVHDQTHSLAEAVRALAASPGELDAAGRKRVLGAAASIEKVAARLGHAAEDGDRARVDAQLDRLDPLLRLIYAQYSEAVDEAIPHSAHSYSTWAFAGAAETTVTVRAFDFRFEPANVRLQAGQPTELRLENRGVIEHMWGVVEPEGGDPLTHLHAAAGETSAVIVRVEQPGRYAVVCDVPGHSGAGMVGELIVE